MFLPFDDLNLMYPIALEVRKTLGKTYTFKQYGRYRHVVHWYYPYNPKTDLQQGWRNIFMYAVANWQSFDQPTKHYYNIMKYPFHMSGYNRYIRYFLNANK